MLSYQTIEPHTLELLKQLMHEPLFYKRKYPEHSEFVALRSLTYFEDAETYAMPKMFAVFNWEMLKRDIIKTVINGN